jgi:hypothetical protein
MMGIDFVTVMGFGVLAAIIVTWVFESWLKKPRVTKIERFHKGDLEQNE